MMPAFCCPDDMAPLVRHETTWQCPHGHQWHERHGIPRFVPDTTYADAFGLQWRTYRKTQLDSHTGVPVTRTRMHRCVGDALWRALPGAQVLEVGCGAGRFTEVLLAEGAIVTSVDLSDAVEANQDNFPQTDQHRIAQADALRLPFAPQQFDVVFCLGVVQHTPDPEAMMAALFSHVKPGGWVILDHYTHTLSYYTKTQPLVRAVLRRLPPAAGLAWTDRLTRWFFPLHKAVRHVPVAQKLLSRLSPVLTYFQSYPLSDALHYEWARLDTHDALTDWFKHFRTRGQIAATLAALGATEPWCEPGGNGIEARARRPLAPTSSASAPSA
jgi:2-polyprenyl-3-methyl-5-hydroxy-6-metoxy-1,4-benzoquinol methylase